MSQSEVQEENPRDYYIQKCVDIAKNPNKNLEEWDNDYLIRLNLGISIIRLNTDSTYYDDSILIGKQFLNWISVSTSSRYNIDVIKNLKTHISTYSRLKDATKHGRRLPRITSIVDEL